MCCCRCVHFCIVCVATTLFLFVTCSCVYGIVVCVLCGCSYCMLSLYIMFIVYGLYNVKCSVCVVGTIPSSLGSLTALEDLRLHANSLSGMMVHFQCFFCVDDM